MPTGARYNVLIADDDPVALKVTAAWLKKAGHSAFGVETPVEMFDRLQTSKPDLLLLDVQFGERDGVELTQRLRADKATRDLPIILISGTRKENLDQVEGLTEGADDYLVKPLNPSLLQAKIDAVMRRREPAVSDAENLEAHGVKVDLEARRVHAGRAKVTLTRKEFDLLALLIRRRGRVLSPTGLLESVWGYDVSEYNNTRTVEVHISRLKKKLGRRFADQLETLVGSGYRLN